MTVALLPPKLTRRELLALPVLFWATQRQAGEGIHRNVILYGREADLPSPIPLRAGPVTAIFDPELAFLRYIRYGNAEILRGLYCAVRNKVWGTVTPKISNLVLQSSERSFRLTFDVDNIEGDINFGWHGTVSGEADGTIRYGFSGQARRTFLKNRLGFAVLHPIAECAGRKAFIEKSGGQKEEGIFPEAISPHQPFFDLRAISHEVAPGVMAEVRFEGDVFEMEDHRNWTDCNYKTYCTPLALPYPVQLAEGTQVQQTVTIRLKGSRPIRAAKQLEVRIAPAETSAVKLPEIGTALAADQPSLTSEQLTRLRMAELRHLRVDLELYRDSWESAWERAAATGFPLEAAVFLSDDAEKELERLAAKRAKIARWLVFHKDEKSTAEKWIVLARRYLRGAPVGAGTNIFFTELNRERPPVNAIDFACYPITPQAHAFDNLTLIENLEGQAHTVRSGHRFLGGKPIAVTPVTLKVRFNPALKGAPEPTVAGRLPSRIDPRQMSLLGAAWTVGSLKYLAENDVVSTTFYETHGWAGLMECEEGSPAPALFPSIPGGVFPSYHVLADVNEFAGGAVAPCSSTDPLRACALAVRRGARRRVLIANLTAELQQVVLDAALLGARPRVRHLDEHSFLEAVKNPAEFRRGLGSIVEPSGGRLRVSLLPYSVARLDA